MKNLNNLLYFIPFGLLAACGLGNDSAGNTTEIENAIAIRVFDDGAPAANVRYQVLPSWYVADTAETSAVKYIYQGTTDSDGYTSTVTRTGPTPSTLPRAILQSSCNTRSTISITNTRSTAQRSKPPARSWDSLICRTPRTMHGSRSKG